MVQEVSAYMDCGQAKAPVSPSEKLALPTSALSVMTPVRDASGSPVARFGEDSPTVVTPTRSSPEEDDDELGCAHPVKHTFIHYDSPIGKMAVLSPPRTVPSGFAPRQSLLERLRSPRIPERTPVCTPIMEHGNNATPSTVGGGFHFTTAGEVRSLGFDSLTEDSFEPQVLAARLRFDGPRDVDLSGERESVVPLLPQPISFAAAAAAAAAGTAPLREGFDFSSSRGSGGPGCPATNTSNSSVGAVLRLSDYLSSPNVSRPGVEANGPTTGLSCDMAGATASNCLPSVDTLANGAMAGLYGGMSTNPCLHQTAVGGMDANCVAAAAAAAAAAVSQQGCCWPGYEEVVSAAAAAAVKMHFQDPAAAAAAAAVAATVATSNAMAGWSGMNFDSSMMPPYYGQDPSFSMLCGAAGGYEGQNWSTQIASTSNPGTVLRLSDYLQGPNVAGAGPSNGSGPTGFSGMGACQETATTIDAASCIALASGQHTPRGKERRRRRTTSTSTPPEALTSASSSAAGDSVGRISISSR